MVKTNIKNGGSIWNIEYSDDGNVFKACSTINIAKVKEI